MHEKSLSFTAENAESAENYRAKKQGIKHLELKGQKIICQNMIFIYCSASSAISAVKNIIFLSE
jgi:hypothetical protein